MTKPKEQEPPRTEPVFEIVSLSGLTKAVLFYTGKWTCVIVPGPAA